MKEIPLTKGYFALVDDSIYDELIKYKWHSVIKGNNIYAARTQRIGLRKLNKKLVIYLHRFILNATKTQYVDHKNGNTLDNRVKNLRLCTNQENSFNHKGQPKQRKYSKYKGVMKKKGCKSWYARITYNGKEMYLGSFNTEQDAAFAYNEKALELFGSFANLNEVNYEQ